MLAGVFGRMRSFRPHRASLIACATLAGSIALLSAPAAMAAGIEGGNALNELTKSEPETSNRLRTSTQASSESSAGTSNSKLLLVVGGAAAVVLLGGIAFAIMRDARRVAPAGDLGLPEARSRSDAAARVRRRRAQAKAARRHRKRNR
jgi:hypothetical protein